MGGIMSHVEKSTPVNKAQMPALLHLLPEIDNSIYLNSINRYQARPRRSQMKQGPASVLER